MFDRDTMRWICLGAAIFAIGIIYGAMLSETRISNYFYFGRRKYNMTPEEIIVSNLEE